MKLSPYRKQIPQFARYLFVGGTMTIVGYACIFFFMYKVGWSAQISNVVVYGVGIVVSYWANRIYTFRSKGRRISEAVRFFVIFAIAYSLSFLALSGLIARGVHPALSQVATGLVYIALTFAANRMWVFKADTAQPGGR